jgi:hypothetical protein
MKVYAPIIGGVKMQEIIIDEEFKRLLPPLDRNTFESLEESILIYGCMNPLVLWNSVLIDGYNRYEIVMKHSLPFNTISLDFDSRDDVLIWIIKTQVERRNLTPMQLTFFRGMHYNIEKNLHGDMDRISHHLASCQNDNLQGRTAKWLAEQYKISPRTITRDGQIADIIIAIGKESEEAKSSILSGETRISRRQLREMSSDSEEHIAKTASEIASGKFGEIRTSTTTDSLDNPVGTSTDIHPLTADIINNANKFISYIQAMKSKEDSNELKKAMRTHIDALEGFYKQI